MNLQSKLLVTERLLAGRRGQDQLAHDVPPGLGLVMPSERGIDPRKEPVTPSQWPDRSP